MNYRHIILLALGLTLWQLSYSAEQNTVNDGTLDFNKQGFTKQTTTNAEGTVAIGNLDGNVQYSRTLYHSPGKGGVDLTVTLSYNTNVQHISPNAYMANSAPALGEIDSAKIAHIAAPEWILGVNGIAVQVLNFETKGLNVDSDHNGVSAGNEIALLVNGYHASEGAEISDPEHLRVLMSNGNVQSFVDQSETGQLTDDAVIPTDRTAIMRGYYEKFWLNTFGDEFWMYPGDGTTVHFDFTGEWFTEAWADTSTSKWRPTITLPTAIKNIYGDSISFAFADWFDVDQNGAADGHPKLTHIYTTWGDTIVLSYQTSGNHLPLSVTLDDGSVSYELTKTTYPYQQEKMLVGSITRQADSQTETTAFQYSTSESTRSYSDLVKISEFGTDINAHVLQYQPHPLSKILYQNGLVETFRYLEPSQDSHALSFEYPYLPWNANSELMPMFQSPDFKRYGRDPFFQTMVTRHSQRFGGDSVTTDYTYDFAYDSTKAGFGGYIYHHRDNDIITEVVTDGNLVTADTTRQETFVYHTQIYEPHTTVYDAATKLVEHRIEYWPSNNTDVVTTYQYDWPADNYQITNPPGPGLLGTFRRSAVTVTEDNVSYITHYNYIPMNDERNISQMQQMTPLGDTVRTNFTSDFIPSLSQLNSDDFYKTHLQSQRQTIAQGESTPMAQIRYRYYPTTGDSGYQGQLAQQREYYDVAQAPYVTRYLYYTGTEAAVEGAGNLKRVVDPRGNRTDYQYAVASIGMKLQRADGTTGNSTYTFAEATRRRLPVAVSHPTATGTVTRYTDYDQDGNRIALIDPNGYYTRVTYDSKDRVTRITKPGDFYVNLNDPRGFTEQYTYDDRVSDGDGLFTVLVQRQDSSAANDQQTAYEFNALGQLIGEQQYYSSTAGYTKTYTYDAWGNTSSETDFDQHTTQYAYDLLNRPTRVNPPGAGQITTTYAPQIGLTGLTGYPWTSLGSTSYMFKKTVIDEAGRKTVSFADALGQVRVVQQFSGSDSVYGTTYFNVDAAGNTIATQNPEGQESTFVYDALNRLVQSDAVDGGTQKYRYDGAGNVIFTQDGNRAASDHYGWIYHKYDALNRVTEDGLNATAPTNTPSYHYNDIAKQVYLYDQADSIHGVGRLTGSWNKSDRTGRHYQYDARGRLAKVTSHFNVAGVYDQNANVITAVSSGNQTVVKNLMIDHDQTVKIVIQLVIDTGEENGIVNIYRADGSLKHSFSGAGTNYYDVKAGSKIELRAVSFPVPPLGEAEVFVYYDKLTDISGDEYTMTQKYNSSDAPISIQYANGETRDYAYNKLGQILSIPGLLDDGTNGEGVTYTPNGRVADLYYHSGITQQFEYNARGWMTRDHIEPWDVFDEFDLNYEYDATGNLTNEWRHNVSYHEATYHYDALNRLDSVHFATHFSPVQDLVYAYDTNGNRTAKSIDGVHTEYEYSRNAQNDLLTNRLLGLGDSTDYSYDLAGNLIVDRRKHLIYRYDWNNRLNDIWHLTWNQSHPAAEPGWADVDSATFHYIGANNTGAKYALKTLPTIAVPSEDGEELNLNLDWKRVSHVDMDRFYFILEDSISGDFMRFEYYARQADLRFTQRGKGTVSQIYEDLNTTIPIGTWTNVWLHIIQEKGTLIVQAYLDSTLVGKADLNTNIATFNRFRIICTEGDYMVDNISLRPPSPDAEYYLETFGDIPTTDTYSSYGYNTDDQRVQQYTDHGGYRSLYWGNQRRAQYHGGQLQYNYVYANGQRLVRLTNTGTPSYFHNDYLGSARRLTDASGTLIWSRDYYPFGGIRYASATGNTFQFTGKERDDQAQLDYSWHRYYDWETGRFTQVDPQWAKYPGLTPYQYAANNPLKFVDPTGNIIMSTRQKNAFESAVELATTQWYTKYFNRKNDNPYLTFNELKKGTVLENPVPIKAKFPTKNLGLFGDISEIAEWEFGDPHNYYSKTRFGKAELFASNVSVLDISKIDFAGGNPESPKSWVDGREYTVVFKNSNGEVIGALKIKTKEDYENFYNLFENGKSKSKTLESTK